MARRRITTKDLRVLGLEHLSPHDVEVRIDPRDLREPNWRRLGLKGGIAHRLAMSEKYWDDDALDVDQVVVAALLERNEHPRMRRRRDEMRMRL